MIIADHSFVVQAIQRALRQTTGFDVVATVDGRTPLGPLPPHMAPDVVVVDEMQDPANALDRLREFQSGSSNARCLLLTLRMDEEWLEAAFDAGADAVISKSVHPVALGTLLREVTQGNVVHRFRPRPSAVARNACPLTGRELEILQLVAEGHTNGRIARDLWVTEQTVKFHLSNTYRKLGVANRTEASRHAHMHGMLEPAARTVSTAGHGRVAASGRLTAVA